MHALTPRGGAGTHRQRSPAGVCRCCATVTSAGGAAQEPSMGPREHGACLPRGSCRRRDRWTIGDEELHVVVSNESAGKRSTEGGRATAIMRYGHGIGTPQLDDSMHIGARLYAMVRRGAQQRHPTCSRHPTLSSRTWLTCRSPSGRLSGLSSVGCPRRPDPQGPGLLRVRRISSATPGWAAESRNS
jgi:hypothetical protein